MQTTCTKQFECKKCGDCCRTRDNVPLTLDDVFRISDFLNMDPDTFFSEYCIEIVKNEGHVGLPYLRRDGQECQFLQDGLCSIHFVKPTACKYMPSTMFGNVSYLKMQMPYHCAIKMYSNGDKINDTDRARKSYMASMMLTTIYYSKYGTFKYSLAKPFVYRILLFNRNRDYIYRMFDDTVTVKN